MNNDRMRTAKTNKLSTTLTIGVITLVMGVIIGGAAAEIGTVPGEADTSVATAGTASSSAQGSPQPGGMDQWNPFHQMRQMQSQMDRMFNQMARQFQSEPKLNGLFPDTPGYSLSMDVRDLKNHYEVHAYLPDAKASNVHVSLKNNRTLNVEVNSQKTSKTSSVSGKSKNLTNVAEWGQYEQSIQLPTPVKAGQMKIKRSGHELIITIPKET